MADTINIATVTFRNNKNVVSLRGYDTLDMHRNGFVSFFFTKTQRVLSYPLDVIQEIDARQVEE